MDRYAKHSERVQMFMPRKKRVNNRYKRDRELLRQYNNGLTYNYQQLGLYK